MMIVPNASVTKVVSRPNPCTREPTHRPCECSISSGFDPYGASWSSSDADRKHPPAETLLA
ncbi:MAG: hypothetical protein ACMUIL_13435, partial [bacterium]